MSIVALHDIDWAQLTHAYGSAERIPELLMRAETDTRPGHLYGSTWSELWSALCHQEDVYAASYAAVPFLVELAAKSSYQTLYDPLLLAASIHVARARGDSPPIPADLVVNYSQSIPRGLQLATAALKRLLNEDARIAFRGCQAAFNGQLLTAENIWEREA